MDSLSFLERASKAKLQPIYAVVGDEDFLKRQVVAALKVLITGDADESFTLSTFTGDKAELAAVRDDLATPPFIGPRRLVIVEGADPFVTRYRPALEKYFAEPTGPGVLLLDVKSWTASTRLAKLLTDTATIVCKAPTADRLARWCVQRAETQHQKALTKAAADLLVDLVGAEMGQLDQELSKLAVYVGDGARIDVKDVDALVGRSREAKTFDIFAAIGNGETGRALAILDELLEQEMEPLAILGAFSWQLRLLAKVARTWQGRGGSVSAALAHVEDKEENAWRARNCEQQLRHLGAQRAAKLFDWLLEADLGLKGSSALPPRVLLERLIVQLARPREK
jgi:DNA polymerase-3 subunit delta